MEMVKYLYFLLDPPMFIQVPKSTVIWTAWVPGEMNFVISGVPSPDIRIYKDCRLVWPGTTRLKLQTTLAGGVDLQIVMRVEQALQRDVGVYTVKLRNNGGCTQYSIRLQVEGVSMITIIG